MGFSRKYLGFSIWKSQQKTLDLSFSLSSPHKAFLLPPESNLHPQFVINNVASTSKARRGGSILFCQLVCLERQNGSGYIKASCVCGRLCFRSWPLFAVPTRPFCQHSRPRLCKLSPVRLPSDGDKCVHVLAKHWHGMFFDYNMKHKRWKREWATKPPESKRVTVQLTL